MIPRLFAHGNQRTLDKVKKIRKQALAAKEVANSLRTHAIMLSLENYSVSEIAHILDLTRITIRNWIQEWNLDPKAFLAKKRRSGRPPGLTPEQREMLSDLLESGPVAYGFLTGVWTSPLIGQVIANEFQVQYHPGHVRKILKHMAFSLQRPTTKAAQADLRQQRKWTRFTYPDLKKSPCGRGERGLCR